MESGWTALRCIVDRGEYENLATEESAEKSTSAERWLDGKRTCRETSARLVEEEPKLGFIGCAWTCLGECEETKVTAHKSVCSVAEQVSRVAGNTSGERRSECNMPRLHGDGC